MELSLEITCFGIHCITASKSLLEITSQDAWNVQVVQISRQNRLATKRLLGIRPRNTVLEMSFRTKCLSSL